MDLIRSRTLVVAGMFILTGFVTITVGRWIYIELSLNSI